MRDNSSLLSGRAEAGESLTVALFGDSIAQGLGVRDKRYIDVLGDHLGAKIVDYSRTGATVADSVQAFDDSPSEPTLAVIAHGITEPILRPDLHGLPLPQRWRRLGWMDPRPYYSSRWRRRYPERVESAVRWRIKNAILRHRDPIQLLSLDEYRRSLEALIGRLRPLGAEIYLVEPPHIDDRYFPGSSAQQELYKAEAWDIPNVNVVPIRDVLNVWDDYLLDHFHPNDKGHRVIGRALVEIVGKRSNS